MKKISIIVPTINEVDNIDPLVGGIMENFPSPDEVEIIFVDDGSTDGTREKVTSLAGEYPVRLLGRDNERGLTGAVLAGAKIAHASVVLVMDADLSHPTDAIGSLVEPILSGEYDMAIGSRYVPGGGCEGWPMRREIASRMAAAFTWPVTDVKDPLAGFFAVKRDKLLAVRGGEEGFKISLEVMMEWRDSLRVCEQPIIFRDRAYGESKLGSKVIVSYLSRLAGFLGGVFSPRIFASFFLVAIFLAVLDAGVFAGLSAFDWPVDLTSMLSFFISTTVGLPIFCGVVFPGGAGSFKRWIIKVLPRYTLLVVLAVFLRGGVIALAAGPWGCSAIVGVIASWILIAPVLFFGLTFYVIAPNMSKLSSENRWITASMGIIAFAFLLRLVFLATPDLMPEEAYYWNYSRHPALGYLDHPPMCSWLILAGTTIFGDNGFGVRIGSLLCWMTAAWFVYRLCREMFSKSIALRGVMLFSILPFFFGIGGIMTPDAPLAACWAGGIYFLYRALLRGSRGAWYGAGICIGLGMLSKYTIVLLGGSAVLFMLIDKRGRKQFTRPEPYAAIFVAILMFSPVIYWNWQNEWASFLFHGQKRWTDEPSVSLHILLGYAALQLTPAGFAAMIFYLIRDVPKKLPSSLNNNRRSRRIFMLVFTLVPLGLFAAVSLRQSVRLNWTAPIWLAMIPWIAYSVAPRGNDSKRWSEHTIGKLWAPTVGILILFYAAGFNYLTLGLPGVPYPPEQSLVGWPELAKKTAELAREIRDETGKTPVVVGVDKYQLSSELAFYLPQYQSASRSSQVAGQNLFHWNALMYKHWQPANKFTGRNVLMIASVKKHLPKFRLDLYFKRLEPHGDGKFGEITVKRNGKIVRQFVYLIGYEYEKIDWP